MGRDKLEVKYREDTRARIHTYKTRINGIEKKAKELSVLCGVDVLFASVSPDFNALHYWPNNPSDFHRILDRYKSSSSNPPCLVSPLPLNSSFQEELVDFNKKLEEVKQRICFLEAEKMASLSQQISEEISMEEKEDCCPSAVAVNDDDDIYSTLEDLGEDLTLKDRLQYRL